MRKKYYMPRSAEKRLQWFKNFYTGMLSCFKQFGLTDDNMTALFNDMNAYEYTLLLQKDAETYYHTCTKFRIAALGSVQSVLVGNFPTFKMPPNVPVAVKAGIMYRVLKMVQKMKTNDACTKSLSISLGIVGGDLLANYATMKPEIALKLTGGFILLKFIKHYTDGLWIECKRGDETVFTYVTNLTSSTSFTDKRPNLIAGKAETRHYRAWFMLGDKKIGLVSDIVTIAFSGE